MDNKLEDIGYVLLFAYSFGGGFFGIVTASVLASLGKMNLIISILLAGGANFIGSTFLFYFARKSKPDAMNFFKKHRRKLALTQVIIKRHGTWAIFIQKFIYGIKTLIPIAAGITKYNEFKFITLNFFASFIWAFAIGIAAYFSGSVILDGIELIEPYPWIAPVILLCVVGILYLYLSSATKKRL